MKIYFLIILASMTMLIACRRKPDVKPASTPGTDTPTVVILTPRDTIFNTYSGFTTYRYQQVGDTSIFDTTYADVAKVQIVYVDSLIFFEVSFLSKHYKWKNNGNYGYASQWNNDLFYFQDTSIMIRKAAWSNGNGYTYDFKGYKK